RCLFSMPTTPTELYTLSLHDALPIFEPRLSEMCRRIFAPWHRPSNDYSESRSCSGRSWIPPRVQGQAGVKPAWRGQTWLECPERSEEHTSELQSRENLVCRLLLEKKK